ncbi:tRNA-splicing endonuclease subunit Sen34-like protein [Sarcoptes scabiei]|nr:tRNA-splicing endonuclease subunit Sen34-like protein [Sarcoptes scabiei]
MIKIKFSNNLYLVWNIDGKIKGLQCSLIKRSCIHADVLKLRKNYRIVGNFVGSDPEHPHQNNSEGLPLILMPEEVRILSEINAIEIVEQKFENISDHSLIQFQQSLQNSDLEKFQNLNKKLKKEQIISNLDLIVQGKLLKFNLNLSNEELVEFRQKVLSDSLAKHDLMIEKQKNGNDETYHKFYIESPFNHFKKETKVQLEPLKSQSLDEIRYSVFKHFWNLGYYLSCGMKFGAHFLAYDHDPLMFHAKYIIVCLLKEQLPSYENSRMIISGLGRLGNNVRKNIILAYQNDEEIEFKHIQWNPARNIDETLSNFNG